jgi:hypothetical protein
VLEEALVIAHKDLDRLILARELMSRVTVAAAGDGAARGQALEGQAQSR